MRVRELIKALKKIRNNYHVAVEVPTSSGEYVRFTIHEIEPDSGALLTAGEYIQCPCCGERPEFPEEDNVKGILVRTDGLARNQPSRN